jgi:hypothetical protein
VLEVGWLLPSNPESPPGGGGCSIDGMELEEALSSEERRSGVPHRLIRWRVHRLIRCHIS